jgi:hypothetical protein
MEEVNSPVEVAERFVAPGFGAALAIWWAWTWRWVLYAAAGVFVLNVPVTGLSLILGGTKRVAEVVGFFAGVFIIWAAQAYTLWNLFGHDFRDFELCLELKETTQSDPLFAPSFGDGVRIWWAWFWRYFLLTFALGLVLGFALGIAGAAAGMNTAELKMIALSLNLLLIVLVSFLVLLFILRHEFRMFRIRLLRTAVP